MAKLKNGKTVEYRDGQGFVKVGLVVGTRDSVSKDGTATRPEKNAANIQVFSPTGKTYFRTNVPVGDGPSTISVL